MSDMILDASAVLAAVLGEAGGEKIGQLTGPALMSAVNYAEVRSRLSDLGMERHVVDSSIEMMGLEVVSFDVDQAERSADLRAATRAAGLSLGDRACIALAATRGAPAMTADRAWTSVDLPVQIELVR